MYESQRPCHPPAVATKASHGTSLSCVSYYRDYALRHFLAEVKSVLQVAGVAGEEAVLYLEDHQFVEPAILETVNRYAQTIIMRGRSVSDHAGVCSFDGHSLLSSGEVPGLYTHEELEPLLAPLKTIIAEQGFAFRTPYEFFVSRIKVRKVPPLSPNPVFTPNLPISPNTDV